MISPLRLICCFLFSIFYLTAFNQQPKYRVLNIPVERSSIQLREPWVGGMNAPQFSSIDLNCDGYKDLFVFDREGNKVLTYINNGNGTDSTFDYSPKYEELFPPQLFGWALIRDYNQDGIPDIFAHANTGSGVYKGSYRGGQLHFDPVSSLLMFLDSPYLVNIWTNVLDIPIFTDVNRDGDIDILTYGITGTQVEYYENQTREHNGDPHYNVDSFKYTEITQCWGNFAQNSLSNSIALNVSCKGGDGEASSSFDATRHSGNTLYSFDDGNDHDVDLLNGNINYDNLIFLRNGGDSSYANMIWEDSTFPICNIPIYMPSYPAAFGLDVNNDGLEDLLISPNQSPGARDVHNVMFYKNVNNNICNFEYQSDSFLVHDMLDFGTDSKPVFFDFNGDGLQDIIIGNYGYFREFNTYKSTLAYYENVGTTTQPKFKQRTDDYGNFSSYGFVAMHPAFGDLDGDGKEDLLVGDLNGYLHFFKNMGTTVASFPSMTIPWLDSIKVGQFSAPFIYDVNGDSLNDLIVGNRNGKLSYFWNMGTKTSPVFKKDSVNANFGNVNVTIPGYTDGFSSLPFSKMLPEI